MSENKNINFELVSPEALLSSEPVYMAVLPGKDGEIGIGADHSSYVMALSYGTVRVYSEKGAEPRHIFIGGGFADITNKNCMVLAEEALDAADIDQDKVLKDLANLREDLSNTQLLEDRAPINERIALLEAKLDTAKRAK